MTFRRICADHNLANIQRLLSEFDVPPGSEGVAGLSSFGVFGGYLVLDALVANRDRNEQNWAVLLAEAGDQLPRLAGSFDHASSLGFNLRDDERERRLLDDRVGEWAERGTAHRFEHADGAEIPSLVTLARSAVSASGQFPLRDR